MHPTSAKRPTNLHDAPIHLARRANLCENIRSLSFGALWNDPAGNSVSQTGSADESTNFRFTYSPKRVTCSKCRDLHGLDGDKNAYDAKSISFTRADTNVGEHGALLINVAGAEVIRVDANGDIYVRGTLVDNDIAVVYALSNVSAGLTISRMGAWEQLCEPCRSMLSCEDAARRLGKEPQ